MKTFKIIFDSGVMETIEAGSIEFNDVLDKVDVKDDNGKEMEDYYMDINSIAAVLPQD